MKTIFTRLTFILSFLLSLVTSSVISQGLQAPPPQPTFTIKLYHTGADSIRNFIDYVSSIYDNDYSTAVDDNDEPDEPNATENIGIVRDDSNLVVERRPVIETTDTTFLFMERILEQDYELECKGINFDNPSLVVTLFDSYTGSHTILETDGTLSLFFSVTSDPASWAPGRFKIVYNTLGAMAVSGLNISAVQKTGAIEVDWLAKTETDMERYELLRSANGSSFTILGTRTATGNMGQAIKYTWLDEQPLAGNNFYKVRAIGKNGLVQYSSIIKMNISNGTPGINVYPNPVVGKDLRLQLNNLAKGKYALELINNSGQIMYAAPLLHSGGSASQLVELKNGLPAGFYRLEIIGEGIRMGVGVMSVGK